MAFLLINTDEYHNIKMPREDNQSMTLIVEGKYRITSKIKIIILMKAWHI